MFFLTGVATRLASSAVAGLMVLKLLVFLAEAAALLMLVRLSRTPAVVLYAWNPLVLIEAVGQAHSEAFLLPLLVGTLLAAKAARWQTAGVLLGAAVMVKLYPLLLLPLLWRRGGLWSVGASVATMLVLAMPFVHPDVLHNVASSLALYTQHFEFFAGPYFLLKPLFAGELDDGGDAAAMLLRGVLILGTIAIYLLDWRRRWSLDTGFAALLGLYIVTATTVHPWYLLGVLAMPAVWRRPAWHWLFLGLIASTTYLRYAGHEQVYLAATWIGWGGFALLWPVSLLPWVIRRRGAAKAARVLRVLGQDRPTTVLDLGCGEGEVGLALRARGLDVSFADVADFHDEAATPFVRYDGDRLPFRDDAFDVVVLFYVLHHCDDGPAVLAEAARVGRRVVVVESVYRSGVGLSVLTFLDKLANRLRGGWQMRQQEERLHFRRASEWRQIAEHLGTVEHFAEHGGPPHRQTTIVLRPLLQQQQLL